MARDKEKMIDMTFLDTEQAFNRGFIHRDYVAHVLRWTHVMKHLKPTQPSKILEAGCGVHVPLARTMYTSRHTMHTYLGADYGPIKPKVEFKGKFQPVFLERTDFADVTRSQVKQALGGPAGVVVSFEVLEHVNPDHAVRMIKRMMHLSSKDVDMFISTPVYDAHVGPASNHVNEWTYDGLRGTFEFLGLYVADHWGTFASQSDYKKHLTPEGLAFFDRMSSYYDSNMLACVMAPMIPPHQARNVLWHLRKGTDETRVNVSPYRYAVKEADDHLKIGQCTDLEAWARYYQELGLDQPEWVGNDDQKVDS